MAMSAPCMIARRVGSCRTAVRRRGLTPRQGAGGAGRFSHVVVDDVPTLVLARHHNAASGFESGTSLAGLRTKADSVNTPRRPLAVNVSNVLGGWQRCNQTSGTPSCFRRGARQNTINPTLIRTFHKPFCTSAYRSPIARSSLRCRFCFPLPISHPTAVSAGVGVRGAAELLVGDHRDGGGGGPGVDVSDLVDREGVRAACGQHGR